MAMQCTKVYWNHKGFTMASKFNKSTMIITIITIMIMNIMIITIMTITTLTILFTVATLCLALVLPGAFAQVTKKIQNRYDHDYDDDDDNNDDDDDKKVQIQMLIVLDQARPDLLTQQTLDRRRLDR